jgi:4a-hydroxytetrahydrobiopterin dehydratase
MAKLSDAEIARALKSLKGWDRDGDFITKQFRFRAFMEGIRFVDDVAVIAESQEHHPDIHVVWTTVTLKIQTHDEGGITDWDVALAKEIEKHLPIGAKPSTPKA